VHLYDKYGPAIDGDYDAIVVTSETVGTAKEINTKRKENGKRPLGIVILPHILADDGKPISSTRILRNEIDGDGRIIS
jgi:pantetheine-phosphate adenylyltransferase